MSIEAMRQAVDALDEAANVLTSRMFADAAAALREAIEQAAKQEPVAWLYVNADMPTNRQLEWAEARQGYAGNWLKYPLYVAPPAAQKPVAYKWKGELFTPNEIEMLDVDDAAPLYAAPIESKQEPVAFRWKGDLFTNPVPLYEHPCQWVGLTNEEIEAVMQGSVEGERMLPYQFARAIETKLKEKNETS
jgi:hypothetical protein